MKKKFLKKLNLNKVTISKFEASEIKGGFATAKRICTDMCETYNFNDTNDCGATNNCGTINNCGGGTNTPTHHPCM